MALQPSTDELVVIGFGAMASAIVEGAIRAGVLDPRTTLAADPSPERREHAQRLGLRVFEHAPDALRSASGARVMLAIKPQMLPEVARDCADQTTHARVISILAGATIAKVGEALRTSRVVRVMPNTPARVGKGISALAAPPNTGEREVGFARDLFGAVGEVVEISEGLMDAFTAVCGSGPAYIFYFAEAMTSAAVEIGFDDATADRIVRATIAGSAALLDADRERSAKELRALVTSKGGTTAAATGSLDESRVMDAFVRAIVAARDRGRELAGQ
jgi:pyrroline-5-carboxylate reductase